MLISVLVAVCGTFLIAAVLMRPLFVHRHNTTHPSIATVGRTDTAYFGGALVMLLVVFASGFVYYKIGAFGYTDMPLSQRLAQAHERYQNRPSQTIAEQTILIQQPHFKPTQERLISLYQNRTVETSAGTSNQESRRDRLMVGAGAMIEAAGGYVSPDAETVLQQLLAIEPNNPMGLYYQGVMLTQIGRYDLAFAVWRNLLVTTPTANTVWVSWVQRDISTVAARAGIEYTSPAEGAALPRE